LSCDDPSRIAPRPSQISSIQEDRIRRVTGQALQAGFRYQDVSQRISRFATAAAPDELPGNDFGSGDGSITIAASAVLRGSDINSSIADWDGHRNN
jgi:hypothetical protein